ncbi:hypothetical protein Kuja_0430 [Vibrio phage vB_VchM_Kuja]|uniref:Holliday junction nuclease RuvC n=1 Tax=Vibrio phage vB_VchM_Kuja TaxID=2686437 RepID=A0A6B9J7N1_9CAUD|nr:RuvC-like Holliday junction resolvase [Vibrio phage vB_VchM_Kuja]QGZ16034.1 hypothetical protein Kuja_0430 [Vibrio phage vB_VchM_Kuja]
MAIVAGLDLSINSPAICVWNTEHPHKFENIRFYNYGKIKRLNGTYAKGNVNILVQEPYATEEERFRKVANWVKAVIVSEGVTDVSLEGYSMGSKTNNICQTAECCSLTKQNLDLLGIPFEIIPPTTAKKYFTGAGNAEKPEIIKAFTDIMGFDLVKHLDIQTKVPKPVDDLADAYSILRNHSIIKKHMGEA